jgi:hypothetical protein
MSSPISVPTLVTKLVIRACGTFHLFSESIISSNPIRTELQGDTLTFYNAGTPLKQPVEVLPPRNSNTCPPIAASASTGGAVGTESGSLITMEEVSVRSPTAVAIAKRSRPEIGARGSFVQKSILSTAGERIPVTNALPQYKVEIIETSKKTVVVDRICYSWEKAPSDKVVLEGKKILVPFWRFDSIQQTANSIPLTANEYRADGVSYTVWTLKTGALASSLIIIPCCYLDDERQKLLVDEVQIYNPKILIAAPPETTTTETDSNNNDNMVKLLTTRKRRCSITEIDHSTTYNFTCNKRCNFEIQNIEVIPTNAHSGLTSKNPTVLHMHGVSRNKFTTSIFYTDLRHTLEFTLRGSSVLYWRMPQSTFWAEHFSVNLQLFDMAQVELDGRVYQLTAELRNQSRLLRFKAKEVKSIKAYDKTYVKGEACDQTSIIWGQAAVIDITKMNDPLV